MAEVKEKKDGYPSLVKLKKSFRDQKVEVFSQRGILGVALSGETVCAMC